MEKTCRHCGTQVTQFGAIFCPHCNKALLELPPPAPPPPAEVLPQSWSEKKLEENRPKARLVALGMSIMNYIVILSVVFDPSVDAKVVKAFGEEPFGMAPQVFSVLLQTILYLPFPWVFYHVALIVIQTRRDGLSSAGLLDILDVDRRHPPLRRSKLICLAGLCYFFTICAVWIIYAGIHKI